MRLKFFGGAYKVGGSMHALYAAKKTFLFDAGRDFSKDNCLNDSEIPSADYVFVTHPHYDHSGDILRVNQKLNHNGRIFSTPATLELALLNALSPQFDLKKQFNESEIRRVFNSLRRTAIFHDKFDKPNEFNGFKVWYHDAKHVPDAYSVILDLGYDNVGVYSGDVKVDATRMHSRNDLSIFNKFKTRFLIMESTYGDREQENRATSEKKLENALAQMLDRNGFCLIPSFTIGRAQEMLDLVYSLREKWVQNGRDWFDIHLEGMGRPATEIILGHGNIRNAKRLQKAYDSTLETPRIRGTDSRDLFFSGGRKVLIAGSGMLHGGKILSYLKYLASTQNGSQLLEDNRVGLYIVGYQPDNGNAKLLMNESRFIDKEDDSTYQLPYPIEMPHFSFSAHASQRELLEYFDAVNPEIFIPVHGSPDAINTLAALVQQRKPDVKIIIPHNGDELDLKTLELYHP